MKLSSNWRIVHDPSGSPLVLLGRGQWMEGELQFPLRRGLDIVPLVEAAAPLLRPTGNAAVELRLTTYQDYATDTAARVGMMESLRTLAAVPRAVLKVEVSGYAFFWEFRAAAISEVKLVRQVMSAKARVQQQTAVTAVGLTSSYTNVLPTVSLTAPTAGTEYTSPASIGLTATASDADGVIEKVDFFSNGMKIGEDLTPPYAFTWTGVTPGTYALTAVARDNADGVRTSASRTVTVVAPPNVPPSVSLTAPSGGASYTTPATINLTATASDSGGTITKVEFFSNGVKIGEDLTTPYAFAWSGMPAGTYSLTAKATDDSGAVVTSSAVSVTVTGAANVAPTVSMTFPSNGASYRVGSPIRLAATAADSDGTITKVEFYVDGVKVGEDLAPLYAFTWASSAAGTYSLTAKAFDNYGLSTTSAAISITATEPPLISTISTAWAAISTPFDSL